MLVSNIGYVIGNGPSLKGFDLKRIDARYALGMNAAYRFWREVDWHPAHYCCLDDQMIETHHGQINALYEEGLVQDFFLHGRFFELHPDKIGNPAFLSLDQVSRHWHGRRGGRMGLAFQEHPAFHASDTTKVTTGAYSVRYMAYKGFSQIALMGIDLRYVEILPEARPTHGVGLVMAETPTSNPNYFFDSYQQEGDLFNIPNPTAHEGNLHLKSFELVRDDFTANDVQTEVLNTNPASLLAEAGIFPLVDVETIIDASTKDVQPLLGAVIIPCTQGEVDQIIANLHAWSEPSFAPIVGRMRDKPVLALVFNNAAAREQAQRIEKAFARLPVRRAFSRLEITYLDLEGARDAYVRTHEVTNSAHGYKAGPNNLFFGAIAHARKFGRYSFLMESDCVPIRAGWLQQLQALVPPSDSFWVMGSAYRGKDQIGKEIARHINGNAIYACGDPAFQSFLDNIWKPALQKIIRDKNPRAAYDFVFDYLQQDMRSDLEKNGAWDLWREHAHLFRYTDYIVNVSGNADLNDPQADIVLRALRSTTTFIVHSAPLALALRQAVEAGGAVPAPARLRPVRIPRAMPQAAGNKTLRFVPTGNVRREEDRYVIAGTPDSNYVMCVLKGAVEANDHITVSVTVAVDVSTTIRAGLTRHDSTSAYESSPFPTLTLPAGKHSFSLEHIFTRKHAACRVQIASASGDPIRIDIVKVEAKRQKNAARAPEEKQVELPAAPARQDMAEGIFHRLRSAAHRYLR